MIEKKICLSVGGGREMRLEKKRVPSPLELCFFFFGGDTDDSAARVA